MTPHGSSGSAAKENSSIRHSGGTERKCQRCAKAVSNPCQIHVKSICESRGQTIVNFGDGRYRTHRNFLGSDPDPGAISQLRRAPSAQQFRHCGSRGLTGGAVQVTIDLGHDRGVIVADVRRDGYQRNPLAQKPAGTGRLKVVNTRLLGEQYLVGFFSSLGWPWPMKAPRRWAPAL